MKRPAPRAWHKPDNTAHLFPVIASRKTPNVFRLTAVLFQEVEPALLQQALTDVLPHFAAFRVRMRHGLFWNYLEVNDAAPLVRPEEMPPCQYIDPLQTGRYLFRVDYFENRVHLETFHMLTDGTGALRFLKAVCYRYLQLAHPQLEDGQLYGLEGAANVENSYLKYATPTLEKGSYKEPSAFKLRAQTRMAGDVGALSLLLPLAPLKALCAQAGVTVGVYLSAVLLYAAWQEHVPARGASRPLSLYIPVNLRTIFGGDTSLNFFSSFSVGLACDAAQPDFAAVLATVQEQFAQKCTKERFAQKLAYTAQGQLNPFARAMPLPLKNATLRLIYEDNNRGASFTFSNLGPVQLEPRFTDFFKGFRFLLSPTPGEPIKCCAVAFKGEVALNFTTLLQDYAMARAVARFLSSQGLEVVVESNGGEL